MRIALPFEIEAAPEEIRLHYEAMIRGGQTEAFALMCALQQPPGAKGTDRAFQEGRLDGNWLDKLPNHQAQRMVREAKAAGISIAGKQYLGGLADKRGHLDPMAWVSDTADVKKVAKARNLTIQGAVNYQGTEQIRKTKDLNPKLAKRLVREELAKNPGMKRADAAEAVRKKHLPAWKKKGK